MENEVYMGHLAISAEGSPCLNWRKLHSFDGSLFSLENLSDAFLEEMGNKCRYFIKKYKLVATNIEKKVNLIV